jgi:hypothetical protein
MRAFSSVALFFGIASVATSMLEAQTAERDAVPLRNWPAPPFWQPPAVQDSSETKERGVLTASSQAGSPEAQLPANSFVFVGMTPCRVIDTRSFPNPFGPPMLAAATPRTFPLPTSTKCTIPASSAAYSLNVTVVPPGPLGFLTVWPTETPNRLYRH